MNNSTLGLPDQLINAMGAVEQKYGFPSGLMNAVMMQESGGQARFFDPKNDYHYPAGPDGVRRTKDGTVSTAFGPFGLLESTVKDPGYGVAPLQNRSIDEQMRFAGDYLAARIKQAGGSLEKGLAGYGSGMPYVQQVLGRLKGTAVAQAQVAAAPMAPVQTVELVGQRQPAVPSIPADPVVAQAQATPPPEPSGQLPMTEDNPWRTYLNQVKEKYAAAIQTRAQQQQQVFTMTPLQIPDFLGMVQGNEPEVKRPTTVQAFHGYGRQRRM